MYITVKQIIGMCENNLTTQTISLNTKQIINSLKNCSYTHKNIYITLKKISPLVLCVRNVENLQLLFLPCEIFHFKVIMNGFII